MGKPRLIILIRHGQSEGNKNRDIHQTVPDHRVKLTPEGWKQAEEAGKKLRSLLRPDDTLHFFTSPYRRTRETTEGILASLTSSDPAPSPFPRHTIKVYEEPRLREQDFGNFQPCSADMSRMWQERADYGHFFYRIPNGESAADAYDRISGFNESLWRSFGETDFASVCVLVTHGLMTRVFLMKWYHFSVEYFEDLRNINHCEFIVMKKNPDNEKYILQNQLRTWSELKKEREESAKSPVPVRKMWNGQPDDCNEGVQNLARRQAKRQNTADLFRDDGSTDMEQFQKALRRNPSKRAGKYPPKDKNEEDPWGRAGPSEQAIASTDGSQDANKPPNGAPTATATSPVADLSKLRILSPSRLDTLRGGRDGGGSESGAGSRAGSPDEEAEVERTTERQRLPEAARPNIPYSRSMAMALSGAFDDEYGDGMRHGVRADALGDQSDMDEDEDEGVRDLEGLEKADKSFGGSVW